MLRTIAARRGHRERVPCRRGPCPKAGRFADEIERPVPVEAAVDGGEVGEGRRLREELESEPVAGIVGIEEVAGEGEELPPVLGEPALVDRVELVEPRLGLRRLRRRPCRA